ncbi:MAG: hydrogenase, partial [Cyanobacteria bacterium HKST-UBA05]|nr:hydrogenase [Cyanobacteria bacterium HKST-UBA05]
MYSILKSWLTAGRLTVPASELALSEATVVRLEQLEALSKSYRKALSRSVMIRHLDAGSCNAEEAELLALANPVYDMSRFGLEITASPRHADILTVSGPVALQLLPAIKQTYDAMPEPKLV